MSFLFYSTIVLFIFTCLVLIGLVLLQKGRGGGLSGAFGGGGGNTAFGAKTGDVLTWATSIIFGVFVLLAIGLNLLANYRQNQMNNSAMSGPAGNQSQLPPAKPQTPATPGAFDIEKPATTPATAPATGPAASAAAATAPTSQPAK